MRISKNFDIREFVPKLTWLRRGINSRWFVNPKCVDLAEFYKYFFKKYYNAEDCYVMINNWHTGGSQQFRGYRPPDCEIGAKESMHRSFNGFDCDIIILIRGKKRELSQDEIHKIIMENEKEFMEAGLTTIEDKAIATTWLHSDVRWTGMDKILIVKP
jgi:hypothetical protein